jgi:zinc/manganese transport system substrate-binding protein
VLRQLGVLGLFTSLLVGCGSAERDDDRPLVVATHSVLGDLVRNVVGDQADVEVVMPAGADPHDFEPSAAQVAEATEADLIVANGLDFEHGLEDALAAAAGEGVPILSLGEQLDPLPLAGGSGDDPHWFTDPERMATAAGLVADAVSEVEGIDGEVVRSHARSYADSLSALTEDVEAELDRVPADRRRLVTNHEVLGYFADRFGFDVVGTVIPSGSTLAEPSAADLGELVDTIEDSGIPALFVDATAASGLADVLADEVGDDVSVVELWSESLGDSDSPASTYRDLIRTNADRIVEALG